METYHNHGLEILVLIHGFIDFNNRDNRYKLICKSLYLHIYVYVYTHTHTHTHAYTLALSIERATGLFPVLHALIECHHSLPSVEREYICPSFEIVWALWLPQQIECLTLNARTQPGVQLPLGVLFLETLTLRTQLPCCEEVQSSWRGHLKMFCLTAPANVSIHSHRQPLYI